MNAKIKFNTTILVIFLITSGLFFIGKSGFDILSGLRAYVGGEGLWAKGQKDAAHQLILYVYNGEAHRYVAFRESLKVPLGDKTARLELETSNPNDEIIIQGFSDGGNHPEDIPTMIFLYKYFKNTPHVKEAVAQWKVGDGLIDELLVVGEQIHSKIVSDGMSKEQRRQALVKIDALQSRLNEAENLFSSSMSAAARWAADLVFYIMLLFTLIGSTLCFILLRLIAATISDLKNKKRQLEEKAEQEKRIRKELQESEDRFRRITENAKDMIYRMSLPDGVYEYVSPAAKKIFGVEPDVFYTSPMLIQDLIHPDWKTYFQEQWDRLVKGDLPPYSEYQIVNPDGETKWLNQRNVLLSDDAGKTIAIEGIVTDVTDQKLSEQLLEKEREQLKSLFDSTDDVIYVVDPEDHKLLFVNRVFREAWGDDAVGKICYEVIQNRESPCPFCTNEKIFGDNIGKTYVWEFQNEIDHHWYRCADKAIRWSDGRWVRFEVATDITDEKLFRQEQVRLEKFSALGQVAAGIAHELNNPLMGVLNYAQYCISETSTDDERYGILEDIEKETKRCIDIVGNFMSASRQDDILEGKVESFDPTTVIESVLKLLEYRSSKEGVAVSTTFSTDISDLLMSRDAFLQLFMNLFTNALDAVENATVKEVLVKAEKNSGNLLLSVIDSGCGVPLELREKIFNPFFTTKPPGKGTGLGLATCWKIVTSQNGHIQCRSRAKLGTEMIVKLPITMKEGNYH